jgi:hypothetical protein
MSQRFWPSSIARSSDRVLATDPLTGVTAAKPVIDTITGAGDKKLVDLTIDTDGDRGDKTATITATNKHPFWVPSLSEWVDAEKLSPQQWLRTSAGTHVQSSAIRHHAANARVHNLTVADTHTYYVIAGSAPILVHNCGGEVEVRIPDWATNKEAGQFTAYVDAANDALDQGLLSSTGRVATTGDIRRGAENAVARERRRAAKAGSPYMGVAGHAPDAMWLGHGAPPTWIDMTKRVNSSLSGQRQRYPVGYKPTKFVLID